MWSTVVDYGLFFYKQHVRLSPFPSSIQPHTWVLFTGNEGGAKVASGEGPQQVVM